MSWEKPSDLELIKDILERADLDYEEMLEESDGKTFLETTSGVYFTFNTSGELEEVSNG